MNRWQVASVLAVVGVAVALIGVAGSRVMARDRLRIYDALAQARMQRLEVAATELANDVEKIGADLELALTLGRTTQDLSLVERDFRAIAAIARQYVVLELRDHDGATVARVDSPGLEAGKREALARIIDMTVRAARERPGALQMSEDVPGLSWHRVFARTGPDPTGLAAAAIIDARPILAKLHLLRGPDSALVVLGPRGGPISASSERIARVVRSPHDLAAFAAFLESIRARVPTTTLLDRHDAEALGLPPAAAVAVGLPVDVRDGDPWTVALVVSTATLRKQEKTIVRRMVAGTALLVAILLVLAGYVIQSSRRSAALHERLRHVDRLAHLTEKAEKILDHIPSGVLALSSASRVTGMNARLRQRFARAIGLPIEVAFSGARADEIQSLMDLIDAARTTGSVRTMHVEDSSLFGEVGRYKLYAIPLERKLTDLDTLVVAEDLREVQRLEGQLLQSEKLATLGVLSAGIAHEIGTPLNIARGWAERGQNLVPSGDPQAEIHRLITEQIDHVTALMRQLLDFVGTRVVAVLPVDAATAVTGVVALLGPEAQRRGIRVGSEVDDGLFPLLADAGQLQQVLVNLVMNAFDACERGGNVVVRARRGTRAATGQLEVVDDGCGIPRALRNQIFDPFFTTKKRGRGTGLGLAVVDQIARAHSAQVEVETEPGRGTVVRLHWPVSTAETEAPS
jgi:two-component system sensor histidine kinase HydH